MAISQVNIVTIVRYWDFNATTPLQYVLEKKNYLINTILYFTVSCKVILFLFFIQSLNALSGIVPGAMCSAGVVGANHYGNALLLLKLLLIFGFGLWLIINKLLLGFSRLTLYLWFCWLILCLPFGLFSINETVNLHRRRSRLSDFYCFL